MRAACSRAACAAGRRLRPWRSSRRAAAGGLAEADADAASAVPPDDGPGGYDFDLVTIGAGSGGVRLSRMAASYGAKVVELPYAMKSSESAGGAGGTCVIRGCVPKKLFVFASHFAEDFRDARGFGWDAQASPLPAHSWAALRAAKDAEVKRLSGIYGGILSRAGVEYVEGRAQLVDGHTVAVGGRTLTARHVCLATGGRPMLPDIPGAQELGMSSDDALVLDSCPKVVAVVGGGYIGLEFAGIFRSFGAHVHLVYRQDLPLRGFDEEVRSFVAGQVAGKGIEVHSGVSPTSLALAPDGRKALALSDGSVLHVDEVLFATGRAPNTRGLGLEKAGVALAASGAVKVDAYSRTTSPSVWAVGDVTDRINLTPVALMEGMALARTLFAGAPTKPVHENVAAAVFSQPPVATVGLTEAEAVARHGAVDVYTTAFKPMRNSISGRDEKFFMKLLVHPASDVVLGVHLVGPDAPEMLQGFAVALKCGATKAQFDATVGIHPTAAEELVTMRTVTRQVRPAVAAP